MMFILFFFFLLITVFFFCLGFLSVLYFCYFFFFFQAEDGIRDWSVTGVQTCALPISTSRRTSLIMAGYCVTWTASRHAGDGGTPTTCSGPTASNRADSTAWRLKLICRSEEHTSELQTLTNLVCRLLLEKKKKRDNIKK